MGLLEAVGNTAVPWPGLHGDGRGTSEQVPPQSQGALWSKTEAGQLPRGRLKRVTPRTDGAGLTCQCGQHPGNPKGTGGRWRCHLPAQGFVSPQCCRTSFTVDSLTSAGMQHSKLGDLFGAWR